MTSQTDSITLPLGQSTLAVGLLGLALLFMGGLFTVLGLMILFEGGVVSALVMLVAAGGLFLWGGVLVLVPLSRLHLVPEGIALSVFGRTYRRYPVGELRRFVSLGDESLGMVPEGDTRLCICLRTTEELAQLRARQLSKSRYYRSNVRLRQERPGWQEQFAREYLSKRAKRSLYALPGREVLVLDNSPLLVDLLTRMYPQVPRDLRPAAKGRNSTQNNPKDTPDGFRAYPGELLAPNRMMSLVLLNEAALIPAACLLPDPWNLVPMCLMFLVFVGGILGILARGSMLNIRLTPEGLRMGKRLYTPVTAMVMHSMDKSRVLTWILVCDKTPEELKALEEQRLQRTARGRELLSACRLSEHWLLAAPVRQLIWRVERNGYLDKSCCSMAHTPQREAWLRERYPELVWLEERERM